MLLLFVVTVLMVGLAACNIGGSDEEQLEKVKVAEVTRSVFYAPLYVAVEQGLFKEEGLDVEVTTVWGGDKTMTALISDGADVALVGSETSIYVSARGSTDPIINFAQLTQTDGTFLVSRERVENFNWDLLKNSDFLGQRKGGMPQMVGEYVLKQHGIHPQNDLNLIQNIDFANIANAYISGTGDYVQLFEPQASMFEKEGRGYIVASFGTESGHVPYTTFMTKESYLTENEETVEKFTAAIYKAQQWVYENSSAETAKLIKNYFEDTDLEIIESSIERYKNQESFAKNPILDQEEWENLQNIMDEAGELPKRVDYNTLVNTEFAEKVMK
jgi:NitT/TauT family transport system substrate-binding protein